MSDRTFEEVSRIWAAKRLDAGVEQIESVHFESSEGYHYSELTYEDPHATAVIGVWSRHRNPRLEFRTINLLGVFDQLIRDLVSIAQEGTPP